MSTYNGWTNYATWRINLEVFDGMDCTDIPMLTRYSEPDPHEVAEYLKEYVDEILCSYSSGGPCGEGLTLSYARAFVSEVNWYEIAMHFVHTWNDIMAEENQDD
jgi:hypothetical protein